VETYVRKDGVVFAMTRLLQ